MIKVNLGRAYTPQKSGFLGAFSIRAKNASSAAPASGDGFEFEEGSENTNRKLVVNLIILFGGAIGLFLYQDLNLPPKLATIAKINAELSVVQKKNSEAAASVEEIKRYEKEQEKLETQIKAIDRLQKSRLREVRVLDYLQREIPEKVWLSRMELNDNKLIISGTATADTELTNFMEALQKSAYLKDINLLRSTEGSSPEFGVIRKFEISCLLETGL